MGMLPPPLTGTGIFPKDFSIAFDAKWPHFSTLRDIVRGEEHCYKNLDVFPAIGRSFAGNSTIARICPRLLFRATAGYTTN